MKEDEIRMLQQELEQLKKDVVLQHQKIVQLQQRLTQLSNPGGRHIPSKRTPVFSLENFIGLRLIHFVGIIVLVIGLSIGVKYAIDRNLISEGMRIMLAYTAGIVLYGLSWSLRKNYFLFSAILFSGGMASLYFTTYAAYVYYGMFSFGLAFLIMILLTFYTVYEAMRYNRQEIALLGLIGAYAIPFLISKNNGRIDLFFLYISLINAGVVFLCIRKNWKNVGRVAQGITWIIFIRWTTMPEHERFFGIGLYAMIFFFLLFLGNIVLNRLLNKAGLTINDTYQLVLNTIALYIGVLFLYGYSADATISVITLVLCVIAAAQAFLIHWYWKEENRTARMFSSLALTLFALFIFFNWNGFTVTVLWLLTAVIVFAWGFKMKSVAARMMAMILVGTTLAKLLAFDSLSFSAVEKVIAYLVLGVLLLVFSFFYQKFKQQLFSDKD